MEHFARYESMPGTILARMRYEVEMCTRFSVCGGPHAVGYRSRKIPRPCLKDDGDKNDTTVWRCWEEGKSLYVFGMLSPRCRRYKDQPVILKAGSDGRKVVVALGRDE